MSQTDSYGRHELLHTTAIIQEMFNSWIDGHGGLKNDEHVLVVDISNKLGDLYQLIGQNTGEEDVQQDDKE